MSSREESLETLRETHSFPGEFDVKVIGDNSEGFVAQVVKVGVDVLGEQADPDVATRESADGTYVSVTMTVAVESAGAILDIYEEMETIDDLRVVL
jgi:putative lipoic acid-binding regulatory protein